jgi:hypothetical protein
MAIVMEDVKWQMEDGEGKWNFLLFPIFHTPYICLPIAIGIPS